MALFMLAWYQNLWKLIFVRYTRLCLTATHSRVTSSLLGVQLSVGKAENTLIFIALQWEPSLLDSARLFLTRKSHFMSILTWYLFLCIFVVSSLF